MPTQVPSVSFASSHLLSLLSVGRITGLVVDSGHLESVALPVRAEIMCPLSFPLIIHRFLLRGPSSLNLELRL